MPRNLLIVLMWVPVLYASWLCFRSEPAPACPAHQVAAYEVPLGTYQADEQLTQTERE